MLTFRARPRPGPTPGASVSLWTALGLAAVLLWGAWWSVNLTKYKLYGGRFTWVPVWPSLGVDFVNVYLAEVCRHAGGDPYQEPLGDPLERKFCYPPVLLPLFTWCPWCSERLAVRLWTAALVVPIVLGAWGAARSRRALGLYRVPLSVLLAGALFSAPMLYALERGNYDLLVVPLLLLAAWAMRGRSAGGDLLAGTSLTFAAALKLYPGLIVLALLPLRRYRVFSFACVAAAVLGLVYHRELPLFAANMQDLIAHHIPPDGGIVNPRAHSLSGSWPLLWNDTPLAWLGRIPGSVAALVLIVPGALWLARRLKEGAEREELLYPLFLWLAAAGTFVPHVANDYNLVYLPLAALAVWDRRDPVLVHLGMALLLLWTQPMVLSMGPALLLGVKYLSLAAVAGSLLARGDGQGTRGEGQERRSEERVAIISTTACILQPEEAVV
jgi:hypothetical protein